jgi:DnaJ family protein A protein 5
MEEENKKKRKLAKKERIDEIYALVRFVKRRDPRVIKQREWMVQEQNKREQEKKREAARRKDEIAAAKEVSFVLFHC